MENKKTIQMPIDRMHYSMLAQLLRNPLIFKLKYILNVYDGKIGPGGMIGRAGHEALKAYYGGDPNHPLSVVGDKAEEAQLAIELGHGYLEEFSDFYVNYGKTGSRAQMLAGYTRAMQFYFAEEPEYNEILMCEEKMEAVIHTVDGQELPLPAVGIPDLVHKRKDGGIEIIDTKFVKSFTDTESEDYVKIIQSQFMWHLLKASKGLVADRMLFREIKYSENTRENAGKPQIRDYAIPFSHEQYRIIFYNIYRDAVRFIANPDVVYLPNLSDPFDGEQAGLLYAQGLISADMSDVEVMHKVKDVALGSKKFVPSRLERVENRNLPPEERIKMRLIEFGIPVEPDGVVAGSSVIQYRFKVSAGVRMSSFEKHKADIARALEAKGPIRILAPIPGTNLVGIEVESGSRDPVKLTPEHGKPGTMEIPMGTTVDGTVEYANLPEMPHLLIAGATGSGKSMLIHSILESLTTQKTPAELELVLIDPKRVELRNFAKVPHLRGKVIYEYEDAIKALLTLQDEMEARYQSLEAAGVRDIKEFNELMALPDSKGLPMKYIVCVIDEFADFMLRSRMQERTAKKKPYASMDKMALYRKLKKRAPDQARALGVPSKFTKTKVLEMLEELDNDEGANRPDANVEFLVTRLAQMARATGIHLIIATQRPSTDVITGIIKANFPARVALTTASPTDSSVILGEPGAEKLAGKGDMLFQHPGGARIRLQGFLIEKKA